MTVQQLREFQLQFSKLKFKGSPTRVKGSCRIPSLNVPHVWHFSLVISCLFCLGLEIPNFTMPRMNVPHVWNYPISCLISLGMGNVQLYYAWDHHHSLGSCFRLVRLLSQKPKWLKTKGIKVFMNYSWILHIFFQNSYLNSFV